MAESLHGTPQQIPRIEEYDGGFLTSANIDVDQLEAQVNFGEVLEDIARDLPHAPTNVQYILTNFALLRTEDEYPDLHTEGIIARYYGNEELPLIECSGFNDEDSLREALDVDFADGSEELQQLIEESILEEIEGYLRSVARQKGERYVRQVEQYITAEFQLKRTDEVLDRRDTILKSVTNMVINSSFIDETRIAAERREHLMDFTDALERFWGGSAMSTEWNQHIDWALDTLHQGKIPVLAGLYGIGKSLYYGYGLRGRLQDEDKEVDVVETERDTLEMIEHHDVDALIIDEALAIELEKGGIKRLLESAHQNHVAIALILPGATKELRRQAYESIVQSSPEEEFEYNDVGNVYLEVEPVKKLLSGAGWSDEAVTLIADLKLLLIPRVFNEIVAKPTRDLLMKGNLPLNLTTVKGIFESWTEGTAQQRYGMNLYVTDTGQSLKPETLDCGTTQDIEDFLQQFGRALPHAQDALVSPQGHIAHNKS